MTIAADWADYTATIFKHSPEYPIEGVSAFQQAQQNANRVASVYSGLLDGLNRGFSTRTSIILGLATATDNSARVDALVDAGVAWGATQLFGAANAVPVGGLVALLRGGYQNLSRNRQLIAYSNQLVGYVSTFAASAKATARLQQGNNIVIRKGPEPTGSAALPTNIPYFRQGCAAASKIIVKINRLNNQRPNIPASGMLLFAGLGSRYRYRSQIESFLYENVVLGRPKDEVLEELRVWARS